MDKEIQNKFVVIIPCLNPDEKLVETIGKLKAVGFDNYILVNDGSKPEYDDKFDKALDVIGNNGGGAS